MSDHSNAPSTSDNSGHRPLWSQSLLVGVGIAVSIAMLGSLLLMVVWFFSGERHVADKSPDVPPPKSVAIRFDDVQTVGGESAELNLIRFDDVPTIGGKLPNSTPQPSKGPESTEEKPETFDLPFVIKGCAPSTDGRHVVVWGYDRKIEPVPFLSSASEQSPQETRLALVEMTTRNVLATRTIGAVIRQIDLNATGAYVTATELASEHKMTVLRLSPEDLKTLDRADILPGAIMSIADKYLVSKRPDDRVSKKYALPGLEPVEADTLSGGRRESYELARRLADGWLLDGVLWDEALETPRLLLSLPDFQSVPQPQSRTDGIVTVPFLQGFVIHAPGGQPPGASDWRLERPRYSPDVPAVLTVTSNRGKTNLNFFELGSDKLVRSLSMTASFNEQARVVTAPGWIFLTLNTGTYVIPAQTEKAPISVPFHIESRQPMLVMSTAEPNQVRYQAKDATKFELEIPGLTNDEASFRQQSRTGEFNIDAVVDVQSLVKTMQQAANHDFSNTKGDVSAWAKAYIARVTPQFVRLTGREPVGVPLTLDAYVRAYGSDLSVAVLHHLYFVEVPMAEFEKHARPSPPPLVARREQDSPPQVLQKSEPTQPTPKLDIRNERVRIWTDTQGRTLQAQFVEAMDDVVIVIDSDRRRLRLPLNRLSESDRVWVAAQPATQKDPTGDKQ